MPILRNRPTGDARAGSGLTGGGLTGSGLMVGGPIREHPLRETLEGVYALNGLRWLGPGSNRRPSAFQADARTN